MKKHYSFITFILFLVLMILTWFPVHKLEAKWLNVPPAPSKQTAAFITLSDEQMAYRIYALMLQNIGSLGGVTQSLKSYNYEELEKWFFLMDHLDPRSDIVPLLAAYYYGAIKEPDKIAYILDYLARVGARPEGDKWRWLAHGVFLARHVVDDTDKALELAYILSKNENPDMADWAKQMPAFILQSQGDIKEAYDIMIAILVSNVDTMHPNEVNFMTDYICNTLLKEDVTIPKPEFCFNESL